MRAMDGVKSVTLLPAGWPRPKGYSNGVSASGRMIFTAGVVGWNEQEQFVSDTLAGQFAQVLRNIVAILDADNAGPEHIVRMTCYVTDIAAYRAALAASARRGRCSSERITRRWRWSRCRACRSAGVVEVKRRRWCRSDLPTVIRGARDRHNPPKRKILDCFASLAMTL